MKDKIILDGVVAYKKAVGSKRSVDVLSRDVAALKTIGRYLSNWDATTGLPTTDPTTMPYTYETGDYYRVSAVAAEDGTNYKPTGANYTGAPSTEEETAAVKIGDIYLYDGTVWGLMPSSVIIDLVPTAGSTNPVASGGVWNSLVKIATSLPADGILVNNTEYRLGTISALTVNGFGAGETGFSESWTVVFTADTGITVALPNTVTWSVATPVFESGKIYYLSFVRIGTGYIGVWGVI